jgi:hypothetical protein
MNYDNPFALRVSERIVSDTIFLDLLSEVPLMTLKQWAENNCLWNQVTYIQSPPGCGKSTLLRMFTPQVLKSISSNRHKEFKKLVEQLGVKSDNDIKKCAVYLLLGRDYTYIEDNAYAEIKQKGLFFALLNARLICAVIKTLMTLTGTVYKDLESIIYNPKEYILEFKDLEFPCNLQTLLNWAYKREETICNFLDNYMTGDGDLPCDSSLFALHAMNPKWIVKKGIQVVDEFIFELDDAHKLTHRQKEFLRQEVVEKRIDSTLWIAERFESLSHADLCKKTDLLGRDYNVFRLNEDNVNAQKRMLEAIAEKRSKMSRKEISLMDSLENDLKDDECEPFYREASSRYCNLINKHCNIQLYHKWMEWIARLDTWKEKAEYYYSFLIYYHRGINKFPEINLFPYSDDSIMSCLDPIRKDADVLVKIDMNIPYFFGHSKLLELSLGNVDQFLDFSGLT